MREEGTRMSFGTPNFRNFLKVMAIGLLSIAVIAQAQSGSVNGQVFCSDTQKPARSARVSMGQNATTTLPDGSFVFKSLPAGVYDLQISYPGYINPQPWLSTGQVSSATLKSWFNLYTQVTVLPGRTV